MDLAEKQIYQHLSGKLAFSVIAKEETEQQGQNYWKSNVYKLPLVFLCCYFFNIQKRNGYFLVSNVNKPRIVQEVICAVHHEFLVAIEAVGPFIITQFQGSAIT